MLGEVALCPPDDVSVHAPDRRHLDHLAVDKFPPDVVFAEPPEFVRCDAGVDAHRVLRLRSFRFVPTHNCTT